MLGNNRDVGYDTLLSVSDTRVGAIAVFGFLGPVQWLCKTYKTYRDAEEDIDTGCSSIGFVTIKT